MYKPQFTRDGASLIEVIVAIGILAMLVVLTIAAVQKVRESALRVENNNNLRQIILGVHQAADQEGKIVDLSRSNTKGLT